MRFVTLLDLIPELITLLLVFIVFIGMWTEEEFSWHFVFILASVIAAGYNAYKNIKNIWNEEKEYDPEI